MGYSRLSEGLRRNEASRLQGRVAVPAAFEVNGKSVYSFCLLGISEHAFRNQVDRFGGEEFQVRDNPQIFAERRGLLCGFLVVVART